MPADALQLSTTPRLLPRLLPAGPAAQHIQDGPGEAALEADAGAAEGRREGKRGGPTAGRTGNAAQPGPSALRRALLCPLRDAGSGGLRREKRGEAVRRTGPDRHSGGEAGPRSPAAPPCCGPSRPRRLHGNGGAAPRARFPSGLKVTCRPRPHPAGPAPAAGRRGCAGSVPGHGKERCELVLCPCGTQLHVGWVQARGCGWAGRPELEADPGPEPALGHPQPHHQHSGTGDGTSLSHQGSDSHSASTRGEQPPGGRGVAVTASLLSCWDVGVSYPHHHHSEGWACLWAEQTALDRTGQRFCSSLHTAALSVHAGSGGCQQTAQRSHTTAQRWSFSSFVSSR